MPSPFPGMNPYFEQSYLWQQVHGQLMFLFHEELVPQVRPQYTVRLEQHIYVHEPPDLQRRSIGRGDVSLIDTGGGIAIAEKSVTAPVYGRIDVDLDQERWWYLEIRDQKHQRVVTVLELLSPSNKRPGDDRSSYLAKRRELLGTPVNFIEIDLLRGGPRMPVRELPTCDYYIMVSRPEDRPRVDLWPVSLVDPLPQIPVPLNPGEQEAILDLQHILHRAYDAGAYGDFVYNDQPEPPLNPDQAEWAKAFIPSRAS